MKKLLGVLFTLLTIISLIGCQKNDPFDFKEGVLVVGLECDYAPFNWTETESTETNVPIYGENGLYAEGYDIQIAKLIAEELGLELRIRMIEWDGLIMSLNSGDIDLIIAGMSPRPDRLESINFTDAYYTSEHVVVVSKTGAYANATDQSDFSGAKIIGQASTTYDTLAEQLATNASGIYQDPLDTVPLIIVGIKSGTYDATVLEKPVAEGVCASNQELKYITLSTPFELETYETIVSIGCRKVDTELLSRINTCLSHISIATREALMLNAINQGE